MIRTMKHILTLGLLLAALGATARAATFTITDYGATPNDETLDTAAIQAALDAAAGAGGGTVLLPAGRWVSGTVYLRSHTVLRLGPGCVLESAPSGLDAYGHAEPLGFEAYQDFGHSSWRNGLIVGIDVEHVGIVGPGTIRGTHLHSNPKPGNGGKAIALKNCRNVTLRDFTIHKGGHFGILATGVSRMVMSGLILDVERVGINLDCCRDVTVTDCVINSDDDGLCLKSSYALGRAVVTENIAITNCILMNYEMGSVVDGTYVDEGPYLTNGAPIDGVGDGRGGGSIKRISRIKFGTESNGGFRNIAISNCIFEKNWGIALETVDGGTIENVAINNIVMREIGDAPLFVRLGNRARGPESLGVGAARNITVSNLEATVRGNRFACILSGLEVYPIEDVTLSNIRLHFPGGGTPEVAARELPERETSGPEPTMFGENPAYGFYFRHMRGLRLDNIEVRTAAPDARPAMVFENIDGLTLRGLRATRSEGAAESYVFRDVTGLDRDL